MFNTVEINSVEYIPKEEYDKLINLLDAVTEAETDECSYDHHAYCQTHALHEHPCPYPVARAVVKVWRDEQNKLDTKPLKV